MNFTSQICTTRVQSERLLSLGLKKETADMKLIPYSRFAVPVDYYTNIYGDDPDENDFCRAWSLHRLIELLGLSKICLNMDLYDSPYEEIIRRIDVYINTGVFNREYLEE